MALSAIPAAGLALFAAYRVYKGHESHLPGHNYIGPGTNLSASAKPVDQDDYIAKEHDLGYHELLKEIHSRNIDSAEFFDRVQELDTKAIYEFFDDYHKTGNWHSLIGAIGLTVKKGGDTLARKPLLPITGEHGTPKTETNKYATMG